MTFGDLVAQKAAGAIGLSYPTDPIAFARWLWGHELDTSREWALDASRTMWTCGVHARAALREAGETDPRFAGPYQPRIGLVISDLENLARERKSWFANEAPKEIGDILIVDGPVHVFVVTGFNDDGTIRTSEGVNNGGKQAIEEGKIRVYYDANTRKFHAKSYRPDGLDRPVVGTIRTSLLRAAPATPKDLLGLIFATLLYFLSWR